MVVVTKDNTSQVADWMAPYWRLVDSKIKERGTFRKNYQPQMIDWNEAGGSSRMDLVLVSAWELRADPIFMITDGTPSVHQGRKPGGGSQGALSRSGPSRPSHHF